MEAWYSKVRDLKDESERPYITETFCNRVFHDLKRSKIREKNKFKERTGTEFESWSLKLEDEFPSPVVREILADDKFWDLTLAITL